MAERTTVVGVLDVLSKFALGAVGLAATLYFNQAEIRQGEREDTRSAARIQAEEQARLEETFARYFTGLSTGFTGPGGAPARPDQDVALVIAANAATRLAEDHGRPQFMALLQSRVDARQAMVVNNVAFQAREARGASAVDRSASRSESGYGSSPPPRGSASSGAEVIESWFVVVSTYAASELEAATAFADALAADLAKSGEGLNVALWRSPTSGEVAVCVGGPQSQADASRLAERLRAKHASLDAFAQPNRSWQKLAADDAGVTPPASAPSGRN